MPIEPCHPTGPRRSRYSRRAFLSASAAGLIATPLGCSAPAASRSDTLTIGAYSVVREAIQEGILPAFQAHWLANAGRPLRFELSFNASGAQARAVSSGFDADVVLLSHEGDVDILVKANMVDKAWKKAPFGGIISNSVVVVGVREGNPHQIADWIDLAKPGVGVLYPDPKTSGGARWNVSAIYGAAALAKSTIDPIAGEQLLAQVQANVINLDSSGRQSMSTFRRGVGDAIVTYENELLLEKKITGNAAPYVIPHRTLRIESPAALVETSVNRHGNREVAEAFLDFLRADVGQKILASFGFRPLKPELEPPGRDPLPEGVFSIAALGGWSKSSKELFGPGGVWDKLFVH